MKRDWLTVQEVAGRLGVTRQAVDIWLQRGLIEGERAIGSRLIHEAAVEQFLYNDRGHTARKFNSRRLTAEQAAQDLNDRRRAASVLWPSVATLIAEAAQPDPPEVRPVPKRDWFTIAEVARQFDVQTSAVHRWIRSGQINVEQSFHGTWLFHESAIEEFRHKRNTQRTASLGKTNSRRSIRSQIDPDKTYRIRSTGERITGAQLLRRRANED